jgi:hypothetical protein
MDIMGFIFGIAGFVFALFAYLRLNALESKLKKAGVLDKDYHSENEF